MSSHKNLSEEQRSDGGILLNEFELSISSPSFGNVSVEGPEKGDKMMIGSSMDDDLNFVDSSRNRANSRVSFTIGDSSDCESYSTASSMPEMKSVSRLPFHPEKDEYEEDYEVENGYSQDTMQWHHEHFHYYDRGVNGGSGVLNGGSGPSAGGEVETPKPDELEKESNRERHSPQGTSGIAIIPNSNFSLGRFSDVEEEGKETSCLKNLGRWRILMGCAIVQLVSGLTISLQAPFYPAEAEKKGASATAYGFVFGVFELTVFIIAPIYGSKIHKWNSKWVFNIGILTTAVASIVFGILNRINDGTYFIAACCVVRVVEALGESALVTACFIIVASAFPDSVASTFAVLESFYSIGLISGPIVGSVLYQIGGYSLPFLTVGGSLLVAAFLSCLILPSSKEISSLQTSEHIIISSFKSFKLLKSASVAVSALCIVLGAVSIGYLQATLEPHLRNFNISQLTVGAIFIINGGVYTITAPLFGVVCSKMLQLKLVTFLGAAVLLCGISVIGPVPIFTFQPKLWIISVGLTLQGIGMGAVLVSSFVSILRSVIKSGYSDDPSTYGLVSSLWTSMFSLGSFIGPSMSGVLYDLVGFSWGTVSVIAGLLLMMSFLLVFVCTCNSELDSFMMDDENEPLLNNTTWSASVYSGDPQQSSSAPRNIRFLGNKGGNGYGSI